MTTLNQAIQNFLKVQAKAKQSEAKSNLKAAGNAAKKGGDELFGVPSSGDPRFSVLVQRKINAELLRAWTEES